LSDFVTKDSGERRQFNTGAQRDVVTDKGRYDLISPIMIERLAKLLQRGAEKYNDRNWEKGMPLSVYMDSGMRHLYKFLEGHRDEDHLIAAIWNLQALLHIEEMVKRGVLSEDLLDLPDYVKKNNTWKNIDIVMEDDVIVEAKINGEKTDIFNKERKGCVLLNMGVKCKYCGWQPEESSFYSTREDMKNVRDHLNKCQKEHESEKHL
jgi:hypothetical protein